ncbi:hypothetical protein CPT_Sonora_063 [Stenotrophomonas phage Sonora]|nr:hypothetical protein CPT_Sonora_063 [Stenotrophomonas phage Sonora]
MNVKSANKYVADRGYPGMEVSKADGVYYLIGREELFDGSVERCLHVVRASDLTENVLDGKLVELERNRLEEE